MSEDVDIVDGAVEKQKRGRPSKNGSRKSRLNMRLDDEETKMLDYLTYIDDKCKSEILRKALKFYYYDRLHKP